MIGKIECPDCGKDCDVKETKKGKPYFACEECGTQHFYRTDEGIMKLMERIKNGGHAPKSENSELTDNADDEVDTQKRESWGLL